MGASRQEGAELDQPCSAGFPIGFHHQGTASGNTKWKTHKCRYCCWPLLHTPFLPFLLVSHFSLAIVSLLSLSLALSTAFLFLSPAIHPNVLQSTSLQTYKLCSSRVEWVCGGWGGREGWVFREEEGSEQLDCSAGFWTSLALRSEEHTSELQSR